MYDLEDDRIDRLQMTHNAVKPMQITDDQSAILDEIGEEIIGRLMDQEADADILSRLFENSQILPEEI